MNTITVLMQCFSVRLPMRNAKKFADEEYCIRPNKMLSGNVSRQTARAKTRIAYLEFMWDNEGVS